MGWGRNKIITKKIAAIFGQYLAIVVSHTGSALAVSAAVARCECECVNLNASVLHALHRHAIQQRGFFRAL